MKQKQQEAEQGEDAFSGRLCAMLCERERERGRGSRREGSREEGREGVRARVERKSIERGSARSTSWLAGAARTPLTNELSSRKAGKSDSL